MAALRQALSAISIHALLAESDCISSIINNVIDNFYPRSPCGERRIKPIFGKIDTNFYPRSPCGERPDTLTDDVSTGGISIHALLAESDTFGSTRMASGAYFYPRSPCGERPYLSILF